MSFDPNQNSTLELERKIQEHAETIKELAKADSRDLEEFDKLMKSDSTLEDLRK